jgi:hypothetical protein
LKTTTFILLDKFTIEWLDAVPTNALDVQVGVPGDSDEGDRGSGLMVISVPGSM